MVYATGRPQNQILAPKYSVFWSSIEAAFCIPSGHGDQVFRIPFWPKFQFDKYGMFISGAPEGTLFTEVPFVQNVLLDQNVKFGVFLFSVQRFNIRVSHVV